MRLNVAYACGEDYAKYAGVSIISLFENNKDFAEIYVYLIDNGMTKNTKNILCDIAEKYQRNIVFVKNSDIFDQHKFNHVGKYLSIIFSKMYLHKIIGINKIIYIDCDMIIKKSLSKIWEKDMKDYLIAGVRMPTPIQYKKWFSSGNDNKYINSGFILFNLYNWRILDVESKINAFMHKHSEKVYIEENVICNICEEKILVLEPEYNLNGLMIAFNSSQIKKLTKDESYYTQKQLENAKKNPIIIHFSSEIYQRPWYENCNHPLKKEYLYFLSISPWENQLEKGTTTFSVKIKNLLRTILPFQIYLGIRNLYKNI